MAPRLTHFQAVLETLGAPRRGFFTRAVPLQFQDTVLSAVGSIGGGRYNAASTFEAYYLGDNTDTVARETGMMIPDGFGNIVAARHSPKIVMTIDYNFQRLADLTDPDVLKRLRISKKSLLVDWKELVKTRQVPLTQLIGAVAHSAGLEGLIVPSARKTGGINIVVIKDNLLLGSQIEIYDAKGFGPAVTTRIEGRKPPTLMR